MQFCNLKQLSLFFLFSSTIFYVLVGSLFKYTHLQKCQGEWGVGNIELKNKNGKGRCDLQFTLKVMNKEVLDWSSYYDGEWKAGKKNGFGLYSSMSGSKYEGFWLNDLRHGKGKFTTSDGTTYDGTWIEDQFTGNGNKITFGTLNPSKYPQRNTEKSYLQGSTYLGGIENSLMFGNGVLSFFDNKAVRSIEGVFNNGHFDGQGKITLADKKVVRIEQFEDNWQFTSYSAKGRFSTQTEEFEWDGTTLKQSGTDRQVTAESSFTNSTDTIYELFDILNGLKWFEFHAEFSKNIVESEAYTFEEVDKKKTEL